MTEPAERLRLFFAVRVPEAQLAMLDEAMAPHRPSFEGARWAPLANQHITLKFLGSVTAEGMPGIVAAGEHAARVAPGEIRLGELGAFPSVARARVLWVGIEDATGLLTELSRRLDSSLAPLGFEPEERGFHPHLTLARFRRPRRLPVEVPDPAAGLVPFVVDELALYRSRLHPKGARYEVLERIPLVAPARA